MKVLVTGGTGFLGRRVVAELAPRHEVRVLVRPGRARAAFPAGVAMAPGDVTDRLGLRKAAEGCEAVVHAAALVKILAPAREFDRINVEGLRNALAAAEQAGVSRFLYVSSFMALGPTERGPGGVLDESAEPKDRVWINDYERTKTLADRLAREAAAAGAPVSILYPAVIYGPGEMTEGNIVVRHVLDLVHRRLPALIGSPDRRWSYAYVDDVAQGVVRALEKTPFGGSRYVLGGDNVTLGTFYGTVAELTGVPSPKYRLPDGVAKAAGALQKGWARLRGSTPALTPDLVEVYRHDWAYSSARAERELDYHPRALKEGLATTIAWLRETQQWTA